MKVQLKNGVVYYQNRIIPFNLRKKVIQQLCNGHNGVNKTYFRTKQLVYWPGLKNEIKQIVSNCQTCDKFKNENLKEPLITHEEPSLPFEIISTDILTYYGKNYVGLIDLYSKWLEIVKIMNKTAKEIISHLKQIFSIHGYPRVIFADNQPFNLLELKQF